MRKILVGFLLTFSVLHANHVDHLQKVGHDSRILNTYQFLQATPRANKTYVLFARHGESEVNFLKRVGGSSQLADLNLTEEGKSQARQLGEALAPFKDQFRTAYTSPLQRAHQTAEIALTTMGYSGKPLQVDERIQEKFFGEEIDGKPEETYKRFLARERAETQGMNFSQKWKYTVVEDAESYEQIYARATAFMLEAASKHPGEVILAFGHKVSSIKVPAMGALAEKGIEVDYRDPPFSDPKNGATAVFEVDVTNQKIDLVAIDGFSFSFLNPIDKKKER